MEFRLTYEGPLHSTQRDPQGSAPVKHSEEKHTIRKHFHYQLERLWEVTPALKRGGSKIDVITTNAPPAFDAKSLAHHHQHYGFSFVPLVTEELDLICGLEILFLRSDKPGKVWQGDIDNRIKTLLDALSVPQPGDKYVDRIPLEDEKPFYCLLEKDDLITKLAVETDQLLEIKPDKESENIHLVITVRLRPYDLHVGNMHMG
jgi:hypothetical protein